MNRKFLLAWLAVFVTWMAGSFIVHGTLLHDDYAALPNLFRNEADAQRHFPLMVLAHVILAGAFVWIYSRGVENRPWPAQGARYGLAVALLTVIPTYLIAFPAASLKQASHGLQAAFGRAIVSLLVRRLVSSNDRYVAAVRASKTTAKQ